LVQKKAAEQEGKESEQEWDLKEIVTYVSQDCCTGLCSMSYFGPTMSCCCVCVCQEPKLTRSRVRQELMGSGAISPEKIVSQLLMVAR